MNTVRRLLSFVLVCGLGPSSALAQGGPGDGGSGLTWTMDTLSSGLSEQFDQFAFAIDVDGDTLVVGAPKVGSLGSSPGSAYVFVRSGGVWVEDAKLLASDGQANDRFGQSVAVSGDLIVVGAPGDDHPDDNNAGSAYVFARHGGTWAEEAQLLDAPFMGEEAFGTSVAIDGERVVVGSPGDHVGLVFSAGTVSVFQRAGGAWPLDVELRSPEPKVADFLGGSVALDGSTIVASASGDDDHGTNAGLVYVFAHNGTHWALQAMLSPAAASPHDKLGGDGQQTPGRGVAIWGDTLIVGSTNAPPDVSLNYGSAWVFTRLGSSWTEQARLVATGPANTQAFGFSVAVEGDLALVSAPEYDLPGSAAVGVGHLFVRNAGSWHEVALLADPAGEAGDKLSTACVIEGNEVLLGCPGHGLGSFETSGPGAVHAFDLDLTWIDLGGGLAGAAGIPSLAGAGTLAAGTPGALSLTNAQAAAMSMLFASVASAPAPFKGGLLVAVPAILQLGAPTNASGGWTLGWTSWPTGVPSGFELVFQVAVADAGAPFGVALSNGLQGTAP